MRICLINPNSTQAMNAVIEQAAKSAVADMDEKIEFICRHVEQSPALINSDAQEVQAAYWTMQKTKELSDQADAFVIACHSDPAVGAVAEVTGKPCYGIGSSSLKAASAYAGESAILVISEASVPRKKALARRLGLEDRFVSIPTGYNEEMSNDEVVECLEHTVESALKQQNFSTVVLGCAGMSCVASRLRQKISIPVIDGTQEAVKFAVEAVRSRDQNNCGG